MESQVKASRFTRSPRNWNKHIKPKDKVYGMSIKKRLNPVSGFIFGVIIGGILGTYAGRYFAAFLFGGAILGLLVGQWCRNQQEPEIEWLNRE